jgi:uncharacterized membrane protein
MSASPNEIRLSLKDSQSPQGVRIDHFARFTEVAPGLRPRAGRIIPQLPQDLGCSVQYLNDAGQVVGFCNHSAFQWSAADGIQRVRDPKFPNARFAATAINNVGTVIGLRDDGQGGRTPNFMWKPGSGFTYFGTAETFNDANAINDLDEVVGERAKIAAGNFPWKAYTWTTQDGYKLMRPHADRRTLAMGINNGGYAAGAVEMLSNKAVEHAVVFSPAGDATWLFPEAKRSSWAYSINVLGQVAGTAQGAPGVYPYHAFVWKPETGAIIIDPRPLQDDQSFGESINDAGQIVGSTTHVDANGNFTEGAFYWDEADGFQDLASLVDPADPWYGKMTDIVDSGIHINASGQITVIVELPSGNTSLLLTPVQSAR